MILKMVLEPKYFAEKGIGHPLLIIWEYDERCLGNNLQFSLPILREVIQAYFFQVGGSTTN